MSPFFEFEKEAKAYRDYQLNRLNYNYKDATLEWNSQGYYWKPRKKRKAKKARDQDWNG